MFTRILIAEPNPAIADLLQSALWLFECRGETYILSRLEEAEALLHRWHTARVPLPDLLLLDISLREWEGRTLLDGLLTWWPLPGHETLPKIVALTTGQSRQDEYPVPLLHMPFRMSDFHHMLYGASLPMLES